MRYNFDYELHRLNVGAAMAREAVTRNDSAARRVRFDFVRDAPDIATYMHALRAELLMKMVMPTVVGNGPSDPFLCMARWEAGPGGNMHWHGMAYGLRGPDMDGVVRESPAAAVGEGAITAGAAKAGAARPDVRAEGDGVPGGDDDMDEEGGAARRPAMAAAAVVAAVVVRAVRGQPAAVARAAARVRRDHVDPRAAVS